jgi:hypothetical protein
MKKEVFYEGYLEDMLETRLYTFSHKMLSDTAKGIQALHSTVEMFNTYVPNPNNGDEVQVGDTPQNDPNSMLWRWSNIDKTSILLDGGFCDSLQELEAELIETKSIYPWASFREDESLNKALTSISIVLTEKIYNTAADIRAKVIDFNNGKIKVLNWEEYNNSFNLYEYEEKVIRYMEYGSFSNIEQKLVLLLSKSRLA